MAVEVEVSVVIARPKGEVFAYVTDVTQDTMWTSGLLEATLVKGPFGPGASVERVSKFLGRRMVYTIEITDVVPGERVDMVTSAGPFPMTVTYALAEADGGTRMTIRTTGEPKGFYALTGPLLTGAVRRQIALDLATLKDVLEAEDAARG